MPSTSTPPIFLLKTRSTPHDSYHDYFSTTPPTFTDSSDSRSSPAYRPIFVPVLEHRYNKANLDVVKNLFRDGAFVGPGQASTKDADSKKQKYGGLIFTSQRAVEGFAQVVQELEAEASISSPPTHLPSLPDSFPLYVVGPATSRTLSTLQSSSPSLLSPPSTTILGSESGTGEALAHYILAHYNKRWEREVAADESKPPLLFLVGETRRDVIPRTLMDEEAVLERRIGVTELVVYETGVMEGFEGMYREELGRWEQQQQGTAAEEQPQPQNLPWTVVFSPTGTDALLQILDSSQPEGSRGRRSYIATIGPTTRDHLRKQHGVEPDVCAATPSPEGIAEGIREFLSRQMGSPA